MGCRDSEKKISSGQLMVVCLSLGMACNIQVKERHRTREGRECRERRPVLASDTVHTPPLCLCFLRPCMQEERRQWDWMPVLHGRWVSRGVEMKKRRIRNFGI
ncbi:hypothetical protein M431DRAFT_297962 [Trichoderma harzianum CBS 226.95]|uniref:Uncharacterized protein n=1 Tax=Trichoderma harzianum CBS 226.95 TaxID=983964 RepID=A0A2T4AQ90_TRIHA|nr:hypothetical protein M431DRAFT_297962 [Trichoderma harzianum CBS 226.95]PTB59227.1 hypothetical protein M431DRAFT_297962 [Trichoderma harzianum CBS 226.95]